MRGHDVPGWARESWASTSWAQYFLKFIVSHPAVTCAIPAHQRSGACRRQHRRARGALPDQAQRRRTGRRHLERL
ncbi:MAG: hypothetical protein U5K43_12130 [Halofilum sp. (in: g-proteobacteria)]|nr:hypothetical protein [Halofilum sp. (in: g-proteobacteria)]